MQIIISAFVGVASFYGGCYWNFRFSLAFSFHFYFINIWNLVREGVWERGERSENKYNHNTRIRKILNHSTPFLSNLRAKQLLTTTIRRRTRSLIVYWEGKEKKETRFLGGLGGKGCPFLVGLRRGINLMKRHRKTPVLLSTIFSQWN